jgi:hypothetical protein
MRIITLILLALSLSVGISVAAHGQTNPPSSVRCPSPADPLYLHFECVGQPFNFIEETLTRDWAGLRTELSELGINLKRPTRLTSWQSQWRPVAGIHLQRDHASLYLLGPR